MVARGDHTQRSRGEEKVEHRREKAKEKDNDGMDEPDQGERKRQERHDEEDEGDKTRNKMITGLK
jgi:hypothetical protein